MEPFFTATRYAKYLLEAKTPHGVHSPFVFDFVNNLLRDRTPYYAFGPLEKVRLGLLQDKRPISVTDFGTGGAEVPTFTTSVSRIAGRQLLPIKYGQLLFRMVNRFQPETILEMGTSLGITTLYLAAANTKAKLITLEGSAGTAAIAQELFDRLQSRSVESRIGEFSETLPGALSALDKLDFLFADGNHRYAPTMEYFKSILPYCHEGSVLVFDDIHWSREMEQAWEEIRHHQQVTLSIDLFRMGILFFHEGRKQEHFTLKF